VRAIATAWWVVVVAIVRACSDTTIQMYSHYDGTRIIPTGPTADYRLRIARRSICIRMWDVCSRSLLMRAHRQQQRARISLKDSTAKPMNLLSRGKEPPHVTHRDSRTFRVITITTTWLVCTRPGVASIRSLLRIRIFSTHPPITC